MLRLQMPLRFGSITLKQARTPDFVFRYNDAVAKEYAANDLFVINSHNGVRKLRQISDDQLEQTVRINRFQMESGNPIAKKAGSPYEKKLRFTTDDPMQKAHLKSGENFAIDPNKWTLEACDEVNAFVTKGDQYGATELTVVSKENAPKPVKA